MNEQLPVNIYLAGGKKYWVKVQRSGKMHDLGLHDNLEDAIKTRDAFIAEHGPAQVGRRRKPRVAKAEETRNDAARY